MDWHRLSQERGHFSAKVSFDPIRVYASISFDASNRMKQDESDFKPVGRVIGAYAKKRTATALQKSNSKGKQTATAEDDEGEDDWEECAHDDPAAEIIYEGYAVCLASWRHLSIC